jgi:hypothetical protein
MITKRQLLFHPPSSEEFARAPFGFQSLLIGHHYNGLPRLLREPNSTVRNELMQITEEQAHQRWCPMVRVEGNNRVHNTKSDGFENADTSFKCIGSKCMAWREYEMTFAHGSAPQERHGYCGLAGKPTALA